MLLYSLCASLFTIAISRASTQDPYPKYLVTGAIKCECKANGGIGSFLGFHHSSLRTFTDEFEATIDESSIESHVQHIVNFTNDNHVNASVYFDANEYLYHRDEAQRVLGSGWFDQPDDYHPKWEFDSNTRTVKLNAERGIIVNGYIRCIYPVWNAYYEDEDTGKYVAVINYNLTALSRTSSDTPKIFVKKTMVHPEGNKPKKDDESLVFFIYFM